MMTIYEDNGTICTCDKDENVQRYDIKDFFENHMMKVLNKDTKFFVYNFQILALFFIKNLEKLGYMDKTKEFLESTESYKLDKKCFKYILSHDNHSFYSISYNHGGTTVTLYEFYNLVSCEIEDLVKDFGGEPVVAMRRAAVLVKSYAERSNTLSSCAYSFWKRTVGSGFDSLFQECSEKTEKLCRDAYHGGLCMINKGKNNRRFYSGMSIDGNSLYPFVMKNCRFAVGEEHYGIGKIPDTIKDDKRKTYFVRFKARFNVKPDHIAFVRTRCDEKRHWCLERLETSDYIDREGKRYSFIEAPGEEYVDKWGEIHENRAPITVELCMYKAEFELFFEQYDVYYIEYMEYVWWKTLPGLFDRFVNELYNTKKHAKGRAERRIAKVLLAALSGRMSSKIKRKSIYLKNLSTLDEYGTLKYRNRSLMKGKYTEEEASEDSLGGVVGGDVEVTSRSHSHIQIGAAITSEAMVYIIRLAQKNYEHFLYTDTDSLHLDCGVEDLKGIKIGDGLGEFKIEHKWKEAIFFKEKVYILIEEDNTPVVTWAGLPKDLQSFVGLGIQGSIIYSKDKKWSYELESIEMKMQAYEKLFESFKAFSETAHSLVYMGAESRRVKNTVKLPYKRRVVKSYRDYTFKEKVENYKVDIQIL